MVPAGSGGADSAFRAAVDLATYPGVGVTAAAVLAPAFLRGGDESESGLEETLQDLRTEAAAQQVTVRAEVRRGNPVREIATLSARRGPPRPGTRSESRRRHTNKVAAHLLAGVEPSVLVLPSAK